MKSLTALFKPKFIIAGLVLAIISAFTATTLAPTKSDAATSNDIIFGGVSNAQQVVNAYNNDGNLQNLYNNGYFGNLGANNGAARFGGQAIEATTYKDGRTVLADGRVVITGGYSAGNTGGPGTFNAYTINIGSKTYYWGFHYSSFASNGLRTLVLMDQQNKYAQFAVLTSCANPVWGEIPRFQCDELQKEQVNDNTYKFWTKVSTSQATENTSVSVQNVHYDFGDGKTHDTQNANEKISHTYDKPGKYTVKVTVTYVVNGIVTQETLQTNCQKEVEVKEKKVVVAKCDTLEPFLIQGKRKYNFVGTASIENATVKSASFDFGDNSTAPGTVGTVVDNKVKITSPDHQYGDDVKEAKIVLTVQFTVKDSTQTSKCETTIKFKEETCKDNPNRPECKPPCIPKEGEDSNCKILPKETCKPQKGEDSNCQVLPVTGPEAIIGSALGLSGLTGAGMYYRASRKNLRDLIKR